MKNNEQVNTKIEVEVEVAEAKLLFSDKVKGKILQLSPDTLSIMGLFAEEASKAVSKYTGVDHTKVLGVSLHNARESLDYVRVEVSEWYMVVSSKYAPLEHIITDTFFETVIFPNMEKTLLQKGDEV